MANDTRWRTPTPLYRGEPDPTRKGIAIGLNAAWRLSNYIDSRGGSKACWPWLGARSGFGYGRMKIAGRLVSPHRVAYVLAYGDLMPDRTYHGGLVMHSCDNPACCNPAHLSLGTARENAKDMAAKGRAGVQAINARRAKLPTPDAGDREAGR